MIIIIFFVSCDADSFHLPLFQGDSDWEDVDEENEHAKVSPKDLTVQGLIEAMFAPSSDYPGNPFYIFFL